MIATLTPTAAKALAPRTTQLKMAAKTEVPPPTLARV